MFVMEKKKKKRKAFSRVTLGAALGHDQRAVELVEFGEANLTGVVTDPTELTHHFRFKGLLGGAAGGELKLVVFELVHKGVALAVAARYQLVLLAHELVTRPDVLDANGESVLTYRKKKKKEH